MRCHCEPRVTYRTPSRRCADDWWSRSPVRSHDVRVAPRRSAGARSMRTCDAVKLGEAAALLFPIDWPEPLGLVMIEALACGTPVIAWRNGSIPEIIQDG